MTATKLTRQQVAQLGGYGAARAAGSKGMADKGSRGGNATLAKRALHPCSTQALGAPQGVLDMHNARGRRALAKEDESP